MLTINCLKNQIDKILVRLFGLEFKSDYMLQKAIKRIVRNTLPDYE